MSQNITLLGASYTDVPSVQLPKTGGGMASFDDTTDADATASDILTGKTAYVNGVKLTGTGSGGSATTRYITLFDNSAEITSDNPNYIWINNQPEAITVGDRYRVTWNNVAYTVTATNDPTIGSQYGNTFGNASILGGATDPSNAPFCAFKSSWSDNEMIVSTTASGTIDLKIEKIVYGDNLTLQTKTITTNGTYTADSGYDALESVTVNVSGSSVQYASGTYTTATKYNSTGNRAITTIATIGFTPKYFLFYVDTKSDVTATQYAVVNASSRSPFGTDNQACRTVVRTSNTSGTVAGYCANTSWNTQTNGYLYLSNGTIYFRTTSSYIIEKDVTYRWEAYG